MRTRTKLAMLPTIAALTWADAAHADVAYYNLFRAKRFTQTTAAAPTTPSSYDCELRVDCTDNTTTTGGNVTFTSPSSPAALTFYGTVAPAGGSTDAGGVEYAWQWASPSFTTQANLDTSCPTETYAFSLTCGTLGTASGNLVAAAAAWTTTVPALDSASWGQTQALDPSNIATLTTVTHTSVTGTDFSGTWIDVIDVATNTDVASAYAPGGGPLSVTIPAGTLQPAAQYQVQIFFSDRKLTPNAGFTSATADSSFDLATVVDFETLEADGGLPPSDAAAPEGGGAQDAATVDSGSAPDTGSSEDSGTFMVNTDAGDASVSGGGVNNKQGCGCTVVGSSGSSAGLLAVAMGLVAVAVRRRRVVR